MVEHNDSVTAVYPLLISDTDGYGYFVADEAGLRHFEQIDIEGNEYQCWDSRGLPFVLGWQGGAYLKPVGMPSDKEGMLAALKKWADSEGIPVASEADAAETLLQIQSVLDERWAASPIGRFSRFLKRSFRGDEQ